MDFTQLFIYFITVNKYRFCISVIGYINVQIIGIGVSVLKNQYRSITTCYSPQIKFYTKHISIGYKIIGKLHFGFSMLSY